MKQDLILNVGSKYDGEGLNKMDSALKRTASTAKTATQSAGAAAKALGSMGEAVGGLNKDIGKVAGGLTSLFSAFTQGGIIGAAIAGVTSVVSLCISKFKEMQEAAINAAKNIGKGFQDALQGVENQIQKINNKFNEVKARNAKDNKFDQAVKAADKQAQINEINRRHAQNQAGMNPDKVKVDNKLKAAQIADVEVKDVANNNANNLKNIDDQIRVEENRIKELNEQIEAIYKERDKALDKLPKIDSTHMGQAEIREIENQTREIEDRALGKIIEIQDRNKKLNENLQDLQRERSLILKQNQNAEDAANQKASQALLDYGQELTTDFIKEKGGNWWNNNVEKFFKKAADNKRAEAEKQAESDKKISAEKKEQAEVEKEIAKIDREALKRQAAEERDKIADVKAKGQKDIAELQQKLNDRIEKDKRDTLLNLSNPGRTSMGDIRNLRRQMEVDEAKAAGRVANIQKSAAGAVENVANRIFKSDGSIRKFSESNLTQLDKSIKDARAAGVGEAEILKRIGGEQNIKALDDMRNDLAQKIQNREARFGANDVNVQRMKDRLGQLDRIKDAAVGRKNLQAQIEQREKQMANDLNSIKNTIEQINIALNNVGL